MRCLCTYRRDILLCTYCCIKSDSVTELGGIKSHLAAVCHRHQRQEAVRAIAYSCMQPALAPAYSVFKLTLSNLLKSSQNFRIGRYKRLLAVYQCCIIALIYNIHVYKVVINTNADCIIVGRDTPRSHFAAPKIISHMPYCSYLSDTESNNVTIIYWYLLSQKYTTLTPYKYTIAHCIYYYALPMNFIYSYNIRLYTIYRYNLCCLFACFYR